LNRRLIPAVFPLIVLLGGGCAGTSSAGANALGGANPQPAASVVPAASPNALAVASPSPAALMTSLDVTPSETRVGDVVVSLAFASARHMVDQARMPSDDPAPQATPSIPDGAASQGALVLSDMLHVTNNLDPTQPLPADSAQSIMRHAVIQVRTSDGGQPVPYLTVTMDVLLDGHPINFGLPAVPMVGTEGAPSQLYYGNNVRLAQRGTYQVFVRLPRNPMLGSAQPNAAQFNVDAH
jgi:hypothetical protein